MKDYFEASHEKIDFMNVPWFNSKYHFSCSFIMFYFYKLIILYILGCKPLVACSAILCLQLTQEELFHSKRQYGDDNVIHSIPLGHELLGKLSLFILEKRRLGDVFWVF